MLSEKSLVGARDHIDNRIADTENIELRRGHVCEPSFKSARNKAVERLEAMMRGRTRGGAPCRSPKQADLRVHRSSCHLAAPSARFGHGLQGTSVFRRTADRQSASRELPRRHRK